MAKFLILQIRRPCPRPDKIVRISFVFYRRAPLVPGLQHIGMPKISSSTNQMHSIVKLSTAVPSAQQQLDTRNLLILPPLRALVHFNVELVFCSELSDAPARRSVEEKLKYTTRVHVTTERTCNNRKSIIIIIIIIRFITEGRIARMPQYPKAYPWRGQIPASASNVRTYDINLN